MKQENTFKQAEISTVLNNAVVVTSRPGKLPKGISDKRARDLRKVAEELIKPMVKFIDGDNPKLQLMLPEELVFTLTAAALYIQTKWVMGRNNVLVSEDVSRVIESLYGDE